MLAAWHSATVRLEQTHDALREEVRRLTDELEIKNRELARKNRLADLGQMASHVAHEVRNNLVPVTLYLSLLRRRIAGDAGSLDMLDKITAGFTALDATVNDLLHFTSDRDPQCQTFPLRKLVEDVYASLAPQLAAQRIAAEIDVSAEQLRSRPTSDMLRRAVLNLVLNALDAMPDGGTLTVTSFCGPQARRAGSGRQRARACPTRRCSRAFEPFFTTKRGGTGLGLAIVCRGSPKSTAARSTAANCPEGGAVFTLRIPHVAVAGGCRMNAAHPTCRRRHAAGRVLVVDDHRQARESMADVLRQSGHRVECCSSAAEALQLLPQRDASTASSPI